MKNHALFDKKARSGDTSLTEDAKILLCNDLIIKYDSI